MSTIYSMLLALHVAVGFVSIILFWVPIASRKGSSLHVKSGNYYTYAMYTVAFSALTLAAFGSIDPINIKYPEIDFSGSDIAKVVERDRSFALFLFTIGCLVLSNVRHGVLTIRAKNDHSLMHVPGHIGVNILLVILGFALITRANGNEAMLFYIFAGLSIFVGLNTIRYCLKKSVPPMEWLVAHLGAMIGAGIGSYTAFFVFGGSRFLAEILTGQMMLIPWVGPGVIGSFFTIYLSIKYRKKYAKLRNAKSTQAKSEKKKLQTKSLLVRNA